MNHTVSHEAIAEIARLLRPIIEQSEPLKAAAKAIGAWLAEVAGVPTAGPPAGVSPSVTEPGAGVVEGKPASRTYGEPQPVSRVVRTADESPRARKTTAIVPLRIGDATVHLPVAGTTEEIGRARQSATDAFESGEAAAQTVEAGPDLELIEKRGRLKAESCRSVLLRRAAADSASAPMGAPSMYALLDQARAMPQCFLWAFFPDKPQPGDDDLKVIARCYEAHAEAAGLLRRMDTDGAGFSTENRDELFQLAAEANSALRVALESTWLDRPDVDQDDLHLWLRRETYYRQIYIHRYMTMQDRADPHGAERVLERLRALSDRLAAAKAQSRSIDAELKRVHYHANQIDKKAGADCDADWRKIAVSLQTLDRFGVPTSDRRIAAALAPVLARLDDAVREAHPALGAVLAATAEKRGAGAPPGAAAAREWSADVLKVRSMLRGRRLVIIGGERYEQNEARIREAFELADVEWVSLPEHSTGAPMRAPIARPDTALVLVLIKLTGHLHADEARECARQAGKPAVSVPGGYNPEQLARLILEQVSERL